jgi:proteasome lid subunit RPN8/RPN11
MQNFDDHLAELRQKYDKNKEHCGFIMPSGVLEVDNVAVDPSCFFEIRESDADRYLAKCMATWHTHTSNSSNLSIEDLQLFQALKDCYHVIISHYEIWLYYTDNNGVVLVEERYHA